MSNVTLNGNVVTHATVTIPAWRGWYADVLLSQPVELSGAVELVVADLTLSGTIIAGGTDRGVARYRIAAGAGAWGQAIAAKGYRDDAGVKHSTIIRDAAEAAGETIDLESIPTERTGAGYTRRSGPAAVVLHELAPENWYVGTDGVTRIGRRNGEPITVSAVREHVDLSRGKMILAADEIATILPGASIDGLEIVDVIHTVTPDELRTTVWGPGDVGTSRRAAVMRRLILQALPELPYRGIASYRVVTQDGERLNLQPLRVSAGLPDLVGVRVMPGVAGVRADVELGATVLVAWVDSDPSRPVVVGFEDAEGPGFGASRLDLAADSELIDSGTEAGRVVRYGDTIVVPAGAGATPTLQVVSAAPVPLTPVTVSRVRA